MKLTHIILYTTSITWNLTVCWPAVLLARLFWGENLRWEKNPKPEIHDGWSLWCDLKLGSWPTRSWYAKWDSGFFGWVRSWKTKETPVRNQGHRHVRYGIYRTWGGTTLGHGGFYGPGIVGDEWTRTQTHEHTHVEQFEVAMFGSFLMALIPAVTILVIGHSSLALIVWLTMWWLGYLIMGISGWTSAWLRGEDPYRGSQHEEAAYNATKVSND